MSMRLDLFVCYGYKRISCLFNQGLICTLLRVKTILRNHDRRKPLFLYVALQAAHTPLQAPAHLLQRYTSLGNQPRRHYAAMLSGVDEAVGEIVAEMRNQGFYRNSVLIYSSDNGGQPLSGGCNWPLRGGKGSYWEGGVRAVGFVHSPLLKIKRKISRALIHVSDWYPTLLHLAGSPEPDPRRLDGCNVWGAISQGLPCPRTEILFNIDPVSRRHGEHDRKLLMVNGFRIWDTGVRAAIRVGDWKLLTGNVGDGDWFPPQILPGAPQQWQDMEKRQDQRGKTVWLFNISADPFERHDLTQARPEVVKLLLSRIAEYNRTAVPPRNPPDDPMADPQLHGGVWMPWMANKEGEGADRRAVTDRPNWKLRFKTCSVCKLRALFRKVGTRLQRAALYFR